MDRGRELGPALSVFIFVNGLGVALVPTILGGPLFVFLSLKLRELRVLNRRLEIVAAHDGLTTLLNRRAFTERVEARLSELFGAELREGDAPLTREALIRAGREADVLVPTITDRIDAEMIAGAGKDLGLIANFGAGTEHIDLAAASARNILVTNTPGVFTDDTADLAMAGIIGVPRRIREGVELIRSGKWTGWTPTALLGTKLAGKVLGIVGMGRIGQAVAHRARAFGLEIAYHNRKRLPEAVERMFQARWVDSLDGLMGEADILSLHCPAGPNTNHMIDARRIALMKDGASLINTGVAERHCLDLISAFKQDAVKSRYDNWAELIDYCRRSAAPVGRYLLDLHGGAGDDLLDRAGADRS